MRDWMIQRRKELNLTAGQVAKELEITQPYYSMIENGLKQKKMDFRLAYKLANVFEMSLEDIAREERLQ